MDQTTAAMIPVPLRVRPIVLYVSEIVPVNTVASSVVVYRHLLALKQAGFAVWCVLPEQSVRLTGTTVPWRTFVLPSRRFYYPPYRPSAPWRLLRWWLLDRELPSLLHGAIHCVISLLQGEYLSSYAEWLSRRLQRPLFYFYHDRGELLHHAHDDTAARRMRRENVRLLSSRWVRRVWSVSPELTYPDAALAGKFRTVYPLPERSAGGPARWRDGFARRPVLAYAGSIYREVVPLLRDIATELRQLGGELRLYSHLRGAAADLHAEFPNVVVDGGFLDTRSLCRDLLEHTSAFVIAYPEDTSAMPWCIDCFPSKLTQLVQTGLPGAVFAPRATSLGRWCERNGWTLFRPAVSAEGVRSVLSELTSEPDWHRAAADSLRAASSDFSPARIEQQVNDEVRNAAALP